jgi:hypothetical protein
VVEINSVPRCAWNPAGVTCRKKVLMS